ncbi:serine protease 28-like [Nymphalis io]|uniref:serine protease 28-like n=1 Tax=Inachis io TaxID=171585 RepID=UPI0021671BB2|nr:serine protease 28-like [Nymphalis io]
MRTQQFQAEQGPSHGSKTVARSTGVGSLSTPAQNGENPWVVHLRVAASDNDGLLRTCVGSIVDASWVLTSASCVKNSRFIWIRYGAADVIRPELVTESTTVTINPDNNLALIDINRKLQNTVNISPIPLAASNTELPTSGKLCVYGAVEGAPGEKLSCFNVDLKANEDGSIVGSSDDGQATEFDFGAPLVSEGVQVGVLTDVTEGSAVFLNTAKYNEWISGITSQQ